MWAHTAEVCRVWHIQSEDCLSLREGTTIFQLWDGDRVGHFYFDPLKGHEEPSGSKHHSEQLKLLTLSLVHLQGEVNYSQERHLQSGQQPPPPESQLEEQVNSKFVAHMGL